MKNLLTVLALSGTLFLGGVAHAQNAMMAPGTTVETTVTTDTGAPALDASTPGTIPTTGGAPIAMALCGMVVAGSAFFMRRKLA